MITPKKKTQRACCKVTNDTQTVGMSINLLNLDNMTVPLQLLAKARYHLSIINDELEQVSLVLPDYEYDLKELPESLLRMVRRLYNSLYANNELRIEGLKLIIRQTQYINECLERVRLLSLYPQVKGD